MGKESSDNLRLIAFYLSCDRVMSLVDTRKMPPLILKALMGMDIPMRTAILSNELGRIVFEAISSGKVLTLQQLAIKDSLQKGIPFIYSGHFYGKGFGGSNRTPRLSLSERLDGPLEGKKLILEFSKDGLINETAYSRLGGSTHLFSWAYVADITPETIQAIPYVIGDLVLSGDLPLPFDGTLVMQPSEIAQFSSMDPFWLPSPEELEKMREIPERRVKEIIAKLLGEVEIPSDWGGEECDLFSSQVLVGSVRKTAAFLLKGPSQFHPMTFRDLGKNGDQIYRLFNIPADIFVVQHCHSITPAVRKTTEAYAFQRSFVAPCRYVIMDGFDTARLLRGAGEWSVSGGSNPLHNR